MNGYKVYERKWSRRTTAATTNCSNSEPTAERTAIYVDVHARAPDGSFHRVRMKSPIQNRRDAERFGASVFRSIVEGTHRRIRPKLTPPTLAEFFAEFLRQFTHTRRNRPVKPSTKAGYESIFRFYIAGDLGNLRVDCITQKAIDAFDGKLRSSGISTKTRNNVMSVLRRVVKAASEQFAFKSPTISMLEVQRPDIEFYDRGEIVRLRAAAARLDPRLEVVVLLGAHAGLRCGEMLGLAWRDVDLKRRVLHVRQAVWRGHLTLPKGGRERRVRMSERLAEALNRLPKTSDRVLVRDSGEPASRETLSKWMKRTQVEAGLDATGGLHILRHTFCSDLALRNVPLSVIQRLAGHESIETTLRYVHMHEAHAERAIRVLDEDVPWRDTELMNA